MAARRRGRVLWVGDVLLLRPYRLFRFMVGGQGVG